MSDNPYYNFLIENDWNFFKNTAKKILTRTQFINFTQGIGIRADQAAQKCQPSRIILVYLKLAIITKNEGLHIFGKNNRIKNLLIVRYVILFFEELANWVKLLGVALYKPKPSSFFKLKSILEKYLSSLLQNETKIGQKINFILNYNI